MNLVGLWFMYDEFKCFGEVLVIVYWDVWSVDAGIIWIFNIYGFWMWSDDGCVIMVFLC